MLALGIDPGTAICGYGFVESKGSRLIPRAYGSIFTTPNMKMEDRLLKIHTELDALIKKYQPDVMGVEKLFFNRNVTTAIPVGQARGVVLLAAAQNNLRLVERTPMHGLWQGNETAGHLHGNQALAPARAAETR